MAMASARAAHAVARLFSIVLFSVALFMGEPPSTHSDGPSTRTDIGMFLFLARAKPKDGLSAGQPVRSAMGDPRRGLVINNCGSYAERRTPLLIAISNSLREFAVLLR